MRIVPAIIPQEGVLPPGICSTQPRTKVPEKLQSPSITIAHFCSATSWLWQLFTFESVIHTLPNSLQGKLPIREKMQRLASRAEVCNCHIHLREWIQESSLVSRFFTSSSPNASILSMHRPGKMVNSNWFKAYTPAMESNCLENPSKKTHPGGESNDD